MVGEVADGEDGLFVEGVVRVFGDEAAMGLNLANADEFGEVGGLFEGFDAGGAGGAGDDADGAGAFEKVPLKRLGVDDFGRGGDDLVFGEGVAQLLRECRGVFAEVGVEREKAGWKAELADEGDFPSGLG